MLGLALLFACTQDDEPTYVRYNGDADSVEIQVGVETVYVTDDAGEEVAETATVPLTSTTGAVQLGTGTVDPSAGPIGTIHTITVYVLDDYAGDVDRVTVRTDSGDRGEDEYDLERDSAGEGWWVFELESVGDEGEVRTDTFTFNLYEEEVSED
jgi:hypothetical protein